jgi:hypothetical protein
MLLRRHHVGRFDEALLYHPGIQRASDIPNLLCDAVARGAGVDELPLDGAAKCTPPAIRNLHGI